MAHNSFSGSTAVVTGGSRGIGAAIGHALALAGARVVLTARDQDALDRQVETITAAGGQASGVVGDTTDPRAVRRTREQAEDTFGPVDLLVVNAGGGGGLQHWPTSRPRPGSTPSTSTSPRPIWRCVSSCRR